MLLCGGRCKKCVPMLIPINYQTYPVTILRPMQKKDRDGWVEGKPGLVASRTIQFLDASGCICTGICMVWYYAVHHTEESCGMSSLREWQSEEALPLACYLHNLCA